MNRRGLLCSLAIAPLLVLARARAETPVISRRLRFTLTFVNPLSRGLKDQHFWCYLPADIAGRQRLVAAQVSAPHRVLDDPLGHRILALSFNEFPAFAQKTVTITTVVELGAIASLHPLQGPDEWLAPERLIESQDPRIRAQASDLHRGTPMATAREIYDWVRGSLQYAGYIVEDLGALQALQHRRGDCTEYAALVAALSRASSIPARLVGGYVTDRDLAPRPEDYHNWAELYLDGAWRIVDAQKGRWLGGDGDYIAFRIDRNGLSNAIGQAHRYRVEGDLQVRF